ncbi:LacI family DNA-binding transcriptional regulator [Limnochorda pilosa]|uniref:LacI family DNA-binding transcriptional regulator n=1 Tax=Limnochorda pilosa TaxID=1555112 RepID=UPI0026E9A914|nr:LacI family DNA-binding transcriptional regulator [Limnochorda pilosa]
MSDQVRNRRPASGDRRRKRVVARATIEDVAREAEVAPSTVSLAFNDPERVRPATRARVLAAARKLNYRPRAIARRLAARRADMRAVVVPNTRNPFFGKIFQGIDTEARRAGLDVMLFTTENDPDVERQRLEAVVRNRADGVILVGEHRKGPDPAADLLAELVAMGIQVVLVERQVPGIPSVWGQKREGCFQAVEHLIGLGHRRIAFIGGLLEQGGSYQRLEGYRRAMAAHGLEVRPEWVAEGGFSPAGGREAASRLLARHPELTAFVAANDLMAIGVLRALREAGRRVPEEASVVGFDDIPEAAFVVPALTTVDMPMERLGRRAMELMLRGLHGEGLDGVEEGLPTELRVRESTGPAPESGPTTGRGDG